MITADNITEEQIQKLYDDAWRDFAAACEARGLRTPVFIDMKRLSDDKVLTARARCAEILNARKDI